MHQLYSAADMAHLNHCLWSEHYWSLSVLALFHLSLKYCCIQQDADNRQFMRDIGMPATTDINELIGYKIQRWWPEVPLPKACKCRSECSL